MVLRVSGFVFDEAVNLRGFARAAGNVLIDGQRPASKTDDLIGILQRVPVGTSSAAARPSLTARPRPPYRTANALVAAIYSALLVASGFATVVLVVSLLKNAFLE